MEDHEFRCLLDLFMVSDPWPLDKTSNDVIGNMLDKEAEARGYDRKVTGGILSSWVVAYHQFLKPTQEETEGGE